MNLKQLMTEDIDSVFLDEDEFASWHDIDGKRILCIVIEHQIRDRDGGQRSQIDGLYLDEITLSVKKTDLPEKPVRGQTLRVDGKLYIVSKVSGSGLLKIILEANDDRT